MEFNFNSKALLTLFLCSICVQTVNYSFSQNPVFKIFDNFENGYPSGFGKFVGNIKVAAQDSSLGISSSTADPNPNGNAIDPSSEPSHNILELLESFRIPFLLLGIVLLIWSYKILKTLEIYEFYNTDKEGVITFKDEKGFEKHKANAKKGKFMLFFGMAILLFGVYLFF